MILTFIGYKEKSAYSIVDTLCGHAEILRRTAKTSFSKPWIASLLFTIASRVLLTTFAMDVRISYPGTKLPCVWSWFKSRRMSSSVAHRIWWWSGISSTRWGLIKGARLNWIVRQSRKRVLLVRYNASLARSSSFGPAGISSLEYIRVHNSLSLQLGAKDLLPASTWLPNSVKPER